MSRISQLFFVILCCNNHIGNDKTWAELVAMRRNTNNFIKSILIFCDFMLLNIVLGMYIYLSPSFLPKFIHDAPRTTLLIANFAMIAAQYFYQTIIYHRHVSVEKVFVQVFRLSFLQAFLMFLFLRIITNGGGLFRFMFIFGATLFATLLAARLLERMALRLYRSSGGNTRHVVFVGSDPSNLLLYKDMMSDASTGYHVLGYYADRQMVDAPEELVRLGDIAALNAIIQNDDPDQENPSNSPSPAVDELFCSLSHDDSKLIVSIMKYCDRHIIHFHYVPRMFGNYRLNLIPEQFGNFALFTNHREPLLKPGNRFIKRTFDVVVSSVVCVVMIPFLPIIAAIIKWQSPGPVFFKQARTGLNGKTFTCYKFRSMHVNDKADLQQATLDDPRKFPFGNFMRRTNIDEFPQFFNVLKGDMSIVGPRPHMLHHTEIYRQLIDKYMVRHFSKPGITGWAQVNGCRGETKELWQMEERINRDIWYIENWTFWLDIKIILKTAVSLFIPDKEAY